jgi:hypothetical protein
MKTFVLLFAFLVPASTFAIELRRETPFPFEECDRSQYLTVTPKATAYVTEVARRIMLANPSVFRGDLAFENFCFGIRYNDTGGRAWATAESRSFVVESGMLTRVQNDAQLAFVVAHELAHVSLRHFHGGYPVSGPAITAAATEIRRINELIFSPNARSEDNDALNTQLRAQEAIINNAITAQFGEGVLNNWEEAEADRVGAQFYLNAGFTSDELAWRPQQIIITDAMRLDVHSPAPQITARERIDRSYSGCNVPSDRTNMSEPVRGTASYPSSCWSIWNLRHNAPATDSEYRTLMNDSRSIINLDLPAGSNLEAVKAEVEAYEPVNPKASLQKKSSRSPASVTFEKKAPKAKAKNKKGSHKDCLH